jgi:hypothetical protein
MVRLRHYYFKESSRTTYGRIRFVDGFVAVTLQLEDRNFPYTQMHSLWLMGPLYINILYDTHYSLLYDICFYDETMGVKLLYS